MKAHYLGDKKEYPHNYGEPDGVIISTDTLCGWAVKGPCKYLYVEDKEKVTCKHCLAMLAKLNNEKRQSMNKIRITIDAKAIEKQAALVAKEMEKLQNMSYKITSTKESDRFPFRKQTMRKPTFSKEAAIAFEKKCVEESLKIAKIYKQAAKSMNEFAIAANKLKQALEK